MTNATPLAAFSFAKFSKMGPTTLHGGHVCEVKYAMTALCPASNDLKLGKFVQTCNGATSGASEGTALWFVILVLCTGGPAACDATAFSKEDIAG